MYHTAYLHSHPLQAQSQSRAQQHSWPAVLAQHW